MRLKNYDPRQALYMSVSLSVCLYLSIRPSKISILLFARLLSREFLDGELDIELVYSHDGVKGEVQRVTVKESEAGGGGSKKDRGRKKDKGDKDGSGGRDGKDKKGKGKSV